MLKTIETILKDKEFLSKLLLNFIATFIACYLAIALYTNVQNSMRNYRMQPPPPPPTFRPMEKTNVPPPPAPMGPSTEPANRRPSMDLPSPNVQEPPPPPYVRHDQK